MDQIDGGGALLILETLGNRTTEPRSSGVTRSRPELSMASSQHMVPGGGTWNPLPDWFLSFYTVTQSLVMQ
mgnify:CR=1 FL=1